MARWKPLPDDVEPEVRRLTEQLRELKDRTELSFAALAAKTAYSKSSWARCLNGRQLPPRQAVLALGRLAGADAARLDVLWELAARAYSRRKPPEPALVATTLAADRGRGAGEPGGEGKEASGTAVTGSGPAPEETGPGGTAPGGTEPGETGPHGTGPDAPKSRGHQPSGTGEKGQEDSGPEPCGGAVGKRWTRARRGAVLAGTVAAVTTAALLVFFVFFPPGRDGEAGRAPGQRPSGAAGGAAPALPQAPARTFPPLCSGATCTGQDPKAMGCGQDAWTAAATWLYGSYVELRYSPVCRAAWGRISSAGVGDRVRVYGRGDRGEENRIRYETDTYTPMVASAEPSEARACALLTTGKKGCTPRGGMTPVAVPQPPSQG